MTSSTPYREFIPNRIRTLVASWQLSPRLHRALWQDLKAELRTRRDDDFRRSVAPIRYLALALEVMDEDTGTTRAFAFYIDPWVKPGLRTVIGARDLSRPIGTVVSGEDHTAEAPDFVDE